MESVVIIGPNNVGGSGALRWGFAPGGQGTTKGHPPVGEMEGRGGAGQRPPQLTLPPVMIPEGRKI